MLPDRLLNHNAYSHGTVVVFGIPNIDPFFPKLTIHPHTRGGIF